MKRIILYIVGLLDRLHILTPLRVAQLKYLYKCRRLPHFRHPRDINEKINWMKFYGDTHLWPSLSDKYLVRSFVSEQGFASNLIPLIGMWEKVDDIDWESLPRRFVMKSTGGSGDAVVCTDKDLLDKERTLRHFRSVMKERYGRLTGEPHYSLIKPRIIAEQLLDASTQPHGSKSLIDYKIWCFDGKPAFIICYSNRHDMYYCEIGVYDLEWRSHPEYLRYTRHYQRERQPTPRPSCLDEMLQMAARLSAGHPEVRVDTYVVDGHVYFGEFTFSSSGGYMSHFTQPFLDRLGELTALPINEEVEVKKEGLATARGAASKGRSRKVIAAASIGGHWVQLLRITRPMEARYDMVYLCTHPKCITMVEGQKFHLISDFSRTDAWKLLPSFFRILKILWQEKPDAIVTTGAAPGLVCLAVGRLMGCKTIWIDSLANAERLSMSGRIASKIASKTFSQWEELAGEGILYAGNVLSLKE